MYQDVLSNHMLCADLEKFSREIIFLNDSSTSINSVKLLGPILYQSEYFFLKYMYSFTCLLNVLQ